MKGSIEAGTYVHCVIFENSVSILPVRFPRIFVFLKSSLCYSGYFEKPTQTDPDLGRTAQADLTPLVSNNRRRSLRRRRKNIDNI